MAEDFMSYDSLKALRTNHPAWKLLASVDAPFCCSFFYSEFLEKGMRNLSEEVLVRKLSVFLMQKTDESPDESDMAARNLLKRWSDENCRWLRRFRIKGVISYDLTTPAQKAVEWLHSLKPRSFVGTESKMSLFIHIFNEIEHEANPDREARINYLNKQKENIEKELEALQSGGEVKVLSDVAVKERFQEAMILNDTILSDCREVKDNLMSIYDDIVREINESDQGKGSVILKALESTEAIEKSPQGMSHMAIYELLMSPSVRENLEDAMKKVMGMKCLESESASVNIRRISSSWLNAIIDVHDVYRKLGQQLAWYVSTKNLEERKYIYSLIKDITGKGQALAVKRPPRDRAFMKVDEGAPTINLPMEHVLKYPTVPEELETEKVEEGISNDDMSALFKQYFVDKEQLRGQIREMLKSKPEVTLKEIIEKYPLKAGLMEYLAYLSLIKSENGVENKDVLDIVSYEGTDGINRLLRGRQVVFKRKEIMKDDGSGK